MHAAQHRALRELFAFTSAMERHWSALARRLEAQAEIAAALDAGVQATEAVRADVRAAMAKRDLYAETLAETAGRMVTIGPPAPDALMERNQAVRFAVLELQHVTTLLAYLAVLAAEDSDEELRGLLAGAELALQEHERAIRRLAIRLGERPDDAIAPADPSLLGKAGQRVGWTVGAFGEWFDRRVGRRRGR